MFKKKRYTTFFLIVLLCLLAFSFFKLLPVTFSRDIPAAEKHSHRKHRVYEENKEMKMITLP